MYGGGGAGAPPARGGNRNSEYGLEKGRKMTPRGEMAMSKAGPAVSLMPAHIKMTFLPPPPLKHLANPKTKKTHITKSYTGIAAFTKLFEKAEDKPPKVVQENQPERRKRLKSEQKASTSMFLKIEKEAYQRVFDPKKSKDNTPRDETINMLTSEIPSNMNMNIDVGALFNSAVDKFQLQKRKVAMNPYNTLFVGRLHYSITDTKLLREFDSFGKVNDIILVSDPYKKAESESDPAQIQAQH